MIKIVQGPRWLKAVLGFWGTNVTEGLFLFEKCHFIASSGLLCQCAASDL